jgi:hypothetical protein
MSDVPELDELIEEHQVFRTNMQWRRREILWVALFRLHITVLAALCLLLAFGLWGLAGVPLAWCWACKTFQPPPPRDPFRRYKVM